MAKKEKKSKKKKSKIPLYTRSMLWADPKAANEMDPARFGFMRANDDLRWQLQSIDRELNKKFEEQKQMLIEQSERKVAGLSEKLSAVETERDINKAAVLQKEADILLREGDLSSYENEFQNLRNEQHRLNNLIAEKDEGWRQSNDMLNEVKQQLAESEDVIYNYERLFHENNEYRLREQILTRQLHEANNNNETFDNDNNNNNNSSQELANEGEMAIAEDIVDNRVVDSSVPLNSDSFELLELPSRVSVPLPSEAPSLVSIPLSSESKSVRNAESRARNQLRKERKAKREQRVVPEVSVQEPSTAMVVAEPPENSVVPYVDNKRSLERDFDTTEGPDFKRTNRDDTRVMGGDYNVTGKRTGGHLMFEKQEVAEHRNRNDTKGKGEVVFI